MTRFPRPLGLLFVLWAVVATTRPAQAQRETVIVEQRVTLTDQLTPAAAKRRALEEAMAEAVRRVVGVRVRSTTISTTTETDTGFSSDYRSVVQLDAAGRAVEVRPQRDSWETVGSVVRYSGVWAITVERETGTPDPGFLLDLKLAASVVRAPHADVARNQELVATVTSSREAHLVLASIVDDSVFVLLPNAYTGPVALAPQAPTELPPAEWRERGLRFRATRPPGDAARDELLVAVAMTGDPIPAFAGGTVLEFQRWLVHIPLDRRTVAFAPYSVTPR